MELYIFNLHPKLEPEDLRVVLAEFGQVISLQLSTTLTDADDHSQVAKVCMKTAAEAQSISQHLNGDIINGRPLEIRLATPHPPADTMLPESLQSHTGDEIVPGASPA